VIWSHLDVPSNLHSPSMNGMTRHELHEEICVYFEETKQEVKRIHIYECRCNEILKSESEGSIRPTYTGLCGGLEHLKIETRLRGGRFESVKGECVI
jgi:hypothetical protein